MILSLKIENFRSIKEPLSLDLISEKRLKEDNLLFNTFIEKDIEILRSLLIYGRNASGKSNVLLALKALTYLVEKSDSFKHEDKIGPYEPFLFDSNSKEKPVKIEIDFITVENKTRFKYIISFNNSEIISEGL